MTVTKTLNEELQEFRETNIPAEVDRVISESIINAGRGSVKGLSIGDRAPEIVLRNQHDERVSLSSKLAAGPVVLSFFRGEWCPFCNIAIRALTRITPFLSTRQTSLLFVHPQRFEVSQRLSELNEGVFDMCDDPRQASMVAFDVRFEVDAPLVALYRDSFGLDLTKLNANGEWNLPVPATFVIDQDGIIKGKQFSHDFTVRVEPGYVIQCVSALPAASAEFPVRGRE